LTSRTPDGEFYRHSPTYAVSDVRSFRKVETTEVIAFFERRLKFFHAGIETKVAEGYCWAITQAAGRSGSSVQEFGFDLDPLL